MRSLALVAGILVGRLTQGCLVAGNGMDRVKRLGIVCLLLILGGSLPILLPPMGRQNNDIRQN